MFAGTYSEDKCIFISAYLEGKQFVIFGCDVKMCGIEVEDVVTQIILITEYTPGKNYY